MLRAVLISIFCFFTGLLSAAEFYYFEAKVRKGEAISTFLKRYEVHNKCNLDKFYEINKLTKSKVIHANRKYKLPIKIYTYDGRSIRSSIKQKEWERAVQIKNYNERILKAGIRKTHYAESKILWVPYHLIGCFQKDDYLSEFKQVKSKDKKTVKTSSKKQKFGYDDLFGKKYKKYEIVDRSQKNKVFYIVSGHGGPDPGAICDNTPKRLCEDEYAYDVALRLARNLRQHGALVEIIIQDKNDGIRDEKYLACDRDEKCNGQTIPLNVKRRLRQRVAHINSLHKKYKKQGYKDHTVVVLHVDSATKGSRKDVFFYHHKNSKRGKKIANRIHNTFKNKYEKYQKGRGYKGTVQPRGLYLINYANPATVFIELANIRNPNDQKRILLNSNRQAVANWLFEGLIAK